MFFTYKKFTLRRKQSLKSIKTKTTTKNIKVLDKAATLSTHIRNTAIRSKESAEQSQDSGHSSPNDYAVGRVAEKGKQAANQGVSKANDVRKKALNIHRSRKNIQKAKQSAKTASKGAKTTAKGSVKTMKKSVKTTKTTIKTTQQTAKATAKTAQASARAAKAAFQSAKVAAKATATSIKIAIKASIAAVKATIAAIKGLVEAIAAGGWIAVVIILVLCIVGLIVGSCFGIFFSNEKSDGPTMTSVITEINTEFTEKIDKIKKDNKHDKFEMSGSRATWKEILAVYSVKISGNPDNPIEVATLDDKKIKLLKEVFWDMNEVKHKTKTKNEKKTLTVTITKKTPSEMAVSYHFTAKQKEQLKELLGPKYNSMWNMLLYGVSSGGDIVTVAESQIGNVGGQPFWSWYGFSSRVEWCACFVSWCANQCGYIDAGIFPKFSTCRTEGVPWFKKNGQWKKRSYTPKSGDIIFFDWDNDGDADHVGIVEKTKGNTVYTIEGNSGDKCCRQNYNVDNGDIHGYGVPLY